MSSLIEEIRTRLAVLAPSTLELEDESALHAGHPGAAGGGGHFRLRIVSTVFAEENRLSRHRLVYDKLADLIPHRIHALSIDARTPEEAGR